jgi:hypothetical protein
VCLRDAEFALGMQMSHLFKYRPPGESQGVANRYMAARLLIINCIGEATLEPALCCNRLEEEEWALATHLTPLFVEAEVFLWG